MTSLPAGSGRRASDFLALHHDPKLLLLPNVWDPLGARLLESLGYPAVATASAAVAFSLGYDDGQRIRFSAMLEVISRIASSVGIPLSADIEGGYAESPKSVTENMKRVLAAGAVGINFEDGKADGSGLHEADFQCERIAAIRDMAAKEGIPLVINARTDVFVVNSSQSRSEKIEEAISRLGAYVAAGADCVYPITVGDVKTLGTMRAEIDAPINVLAGASTAPMQELESLGISRLSLGPGLIRASLTAMKKVAVELQETGSYDSFSRGIMSSGDIRELVEKSQMPETQVRITESEE